MFYIWIWSELFVTCGVGTAYHSGAPVFTPLPRVLNGRVLVGLVLFMLPN
jgi:hypothetical protein